MDERPQDQPPPVTPPPNYSVPPQAAQQQQYAQYYRSQGLVYQGSPDMLQALADGYFGLNLAFVANVVLALGARFALPMLVTSASPGDSTAVFVFFGGLFLLFVLIVFITYPYNKKIGYGKGWAPSAAVLASLLMGLNSALCCGIAGYIVMQQIAYQEMKKYGVPVKFLGLQKRDVQNVIDALRQQQQQPQPPFQTPS